MPFEALAGEAALLLNMVPEWAADAAKRITWIVGVMRQDEGNRHAAGVTPPRTTRPACTRTPATRARGQRCPSP